MSEDRLDRQLRIEGWDQRALEEATLGIVGDDDLLASLYVLSAAALGLQKLVVIAPRLDRRLLETGHRLNPALRIAHAEGYYTHPVLNGFLAGCNILVDLSHYGLATKLLLQKAFAEGVPVVRAFCQEEDGEQGFTVFTYMRGREGGEFEDLVGRNNLPREHFDDAVFSLIASGIALEETRNIAAGRPVAAGVIGYRRARLTGAQCEPGLCIVGAGALGNFVALGLAYSGFQNITVIDPDVVDVTNLNRQVLLAGAVGGSKAEALAGTLWEFFGIQVRTRTERFGRNTDVSGYDALFDCVDNYDTRIILSERCKEEGKILISGGTGPMAGQVIVYDPREGDDTPAELLGLYGIVEGRAGGASRRDRASCAYAPEASVIMVNQIIGGFMVEALRMLLDGRRPGNIFYESGSGRTW